MDFGHTDYLPVAPPAFALLAGLAALLFLLVQLRLLQYVYMQLGVSSSTAVYLLLASLLGGYVNIPIATLGRQTMVSEDEVIYFGVPYVVPHFVHAPEVILAVNVGGAVVPTLLSVYLLSKNALWGRGLVATLCVAAISYACAEPLAATLVAAVVSWRDAAPLAYAGGCLGVLIGADLLNLDKLEGIGTPVLSIGGAGTFDGVFLTGVLAVLLASLIGAVKRRRGEPLQAS
jgi:uncharacterized membrane protein